MRHRHRNSPHRRIRLAATSPTGCSRRRQTRRRKKMPLTSVDHRAAPWGRIIARNAKSTTIVAGCHHRVWGCVRGCRLGDGPRAERSMQVHPCAGAGTSVCRIGTEKFRGLCSIGDDTTPRFADGDAVDFDHEYEHHSVFIACSAVEFVPRWLALLQDGPSPGSVPEFGPPMPVSVCRFVISLTCHATRNSALQAAPLARKRYCVCTRSFPRGAITAGGSRARRGTAVSCSRPRPLDLRQEIVPCRRRARNGKRVPQEFRTSPNADPAVERQGAGSQTALPVSKPPFAHQAKTVARSSSCSGSTGGSSSRY